LKLNEIAFVLPNAEYEPEQFPGLVYRIKDPKVAFLLFGSGKIVCTGGRNVKDVGKAIKKLEDELKEIGAYFWYAGDAAIKSALTLKTTTLKKK